MELLDEEASVEAELRLEDADVAVVEKVDLNVELVR